MPHDKVQTPGVLPDTLVESLRQQIHDLPAKKKYTPKPKASEAEAGEKKEKENKKKDKDKKKKKKKRTKKDPNECSHQSFVS